MTTPSLAYAAKLLCSFCGKDHEEVRKLIAGPTVFICDECVRLCQDILDEPPAEPAPVFTPAQEERAAQIAREIVTQVLRGSDKRIRNMMRAGAVADSPAVESASVEGTARFGEATQESSARHQLAPGEMRRTDRNDHRLDEVAPATAATNPEAASAPTSTPAQEIRKIVMEVIAAQVADARTIIQNSARRHSEVSDQVLRAHLAPAQDVQA